MMRALKIGADGEANEDCAGKIVHEERTRAAVALSNAGGAK
jgi:hypothetical protein